jgi:hypothetical protein
MPNVQSVNMENFPLNVGPQINSERALALQNQCKSKYLQRMLILSISCMHISPLFHQTPNAYPPFQETCTAPPSFKDKSTEHVYVHNTELQPVGQSRK